MSRGKRFQKEKFSFKKNIALLFEVICIIVMIYSGSKIYNWWVENQKSKLILSEIAEDIVIIPASENQEDEYKIDFESLKSKNPNTIGFLKVNGIEGIEFPVVKYTDNQYYLTHSFDNSYSSAGWIFADYRNNVDGNDKNLIIYGHNRRDGSMFCDLKNALNSDWYSVEENRKILFITENQKLTYQVFSVYKTPVEDYYITTDFADGEYEKFIETIRNRSIENFNVDVNSDDKILTLSTCDNNSQYRIVIHSKKINE